MDSAAVTDKPFSATFVVIHVPAGFFGFASGQFIADPLCKFSGSTSRIDSNYFFFFPALYITDLLYAGRLVTRTYLAGIVLRVCDAL